jgi:hypothetical protein
VRPSVALHGLAWLAAQEQHDQPGGVTRDPRKPAMGGRHASCDIGPRRHNRVSLTLPVGHGQSPAEFYKGSVNLYILSLCQRPR